MRRLMPIAIVLCLLATCFAQPTTAPATQAEWQITITSVEGRIQGRIAPDQPLINLAVGMKFPEGGEIRNGVHSAFRFTVPSGQEITLDRLGIYRIDPEMIEKYSAVDSGAIAAPSPVFRIYSGPPRPSDWVNFTQGLSATTRTTTAP